MSEVKGFAECASVFAREEVLTAAVLYRFLHHGTVINIRGRSYRLREKHQAGSFNSPIEGKDNKEKRQ